MRMWLTIWEIGVLWGTVALVGTLVTLGVVFAAHGTETFQRVRRSILVGAFLGYVAGSLLAFTAHELGFMTYARWVGVPECYGPSCQVGRDTGYLPELERWTGPVK